MGLWDLPRDICTIFKFEVWGEVLRRFYEFACLDCKQFAVADTYAIIKFNILWKITLSHIERSVKAVEFTICVFKRHVDDVLGVVITVDVYAEIDAAVDFLIHLAELNLLQTIIQRVYELFTIYVSVAVADIIPDRIWFYEMIRIIKVFSIQ